MLAPTREFQLASSKSWFHRAYLAVIAIKGFDGAVETLAGLTVLIVGKTQLYNLALAFTAPEIDGQPISHTGHMIRHGAEGLMQASATFLIVYLLAHGIIKLGIAVALIRERSTWIFPVAVVVLAGFVAFMGYKLALHWSLWLLGFAIFDAVTIALVLNEWRNFSTNVKLRAVPALTD